MSSKLSLVSECHLNSGGTFHARACTNNLSDGTKSVYPKFTNEKYSFTTVNIYLGHSPVDLFKKCKQ